MPANFRCRALLLWYKGYGEVSVPTVKSRFEKAQQEVNDLPDRPDNNTLLKLYALYKQATHGDASGERPGGFDFVRRAKFDAWAGIKGTSTEDAMRQYVDLVVSLKG